jgi:hypothetical protein
MAVRRHQNSLVKIAGPVQSDDDIVHVGVQKSPTLRQNVSRNELQDLHQTKFAHFNNCEKKSQSSVGSIGRDNRPAIAMRNQGDDKIVCVVQTSQATLQFNAMSGNIVGSLGHFATNGKIAAPESGRLFKSMKAKKSARQIDQMFDPIRLSEVPTDGSLINKFSENSIQDRFRFEKQHRLEFGSDKCVMRCQILVVISIQNNRLCHS